MKFVFKITLLSIFLYFKSYSQSINKLITYNSIGDIKIGMTIEQVKDVKRINFNPYKIPNPYRLDLEDKDSLDCLILGKIELHFKNSKLYEIWCYDKNYISKDGISVGSKFRDLQKKKIIVEYGEMDNPTIEEQLIVTINNDNNIRYLISAKKFSVNLKTVEIETPDGLTRSIVKNFKEIPDDAEVMEIQLENGVLQNKIDQEMGLQEIVRQKENDNEIYSGIQKMAYYEKFIDEKNKDYLELIEKQISNGEIKLKTPFETEIEYFKRIASKYKEFESNYNDIVIDKGLQDSLFGKIFKTKNLIIDLNPEYYNANTRIWNLSLSMAGSLFESVNLNLSIDPTLAEKIYSSRSNNTIYGLVKFDLSRKPYLMGFEISANNNNSFLKVFFNKSYYSNCKPVNSKALCYDNFLQIPQPEYYHYISSDYKYGVYRNELDNDRTIYLKMLNSECESITPLGIDISITTVSFGSKQIAFCGELNGHPKLKIAFLADPQNEILISEDASFDPNDYGHYECLNYTPLNDYLIGLIQFGDSYFIRYVNLNKREIVKEIPISYFINPSHGNEIIYKSLSSDFLLSFTTEPVRYESENFNSGLVKSIINYDSLELWIPFYFKNNLKNSKETLGNIEDYANLQFGNLDIAGNLNGNYTNLKETVMNRIIYERIDLLTGKYKGFIDSETNMSYPDAETFVRNYFFR